MRRLLLIALASALVVGAFAGIAAAQRVDDATPAAPRAPFQVPAHAPTADPDQAAAFGYRTSAALARDLQPDAPDDTRTHGASAGGAAATITVTATVLPVATITLDHDGAVDEIVVNTPDRRAGDLLYVVRDHTGTALDAISDSDWTTIRASLLRTTAGVGTVYSR